MRYLGGKHKHSKLISSEINKVIKNKYYLEPFCGTFAVGTHVTGKRIANDANPYIVELLKKIADGWIPPDIISEEEYKDIKNNKEKYSKELVAFVGFGCSFAGKWFGGYARSNRKKDRYAALEAKTSLLKIKDKIQNTIFLSQDYKLFSPNNMVIYCDPPYKSTTGYSFGKNFNTEEFWDIVNLWAKNNIVFVSEFNAPSNCEIIHEWVLKTTFNGTGVSKKYQSEKLYLVNHE